MRIPAIQGVIDRRILVNYRVDHDAMAAALPPPFRPLTVSGYAIGGICLIRLKAVRPKALPLPFGIGSENAAHRIAVQWDEAGATREGVYIPRRDTNLRFNTWVGGRLFPGVHHHAAFTTRESDEHLSVTIASDDGDVRLSVEASPCDTLPQGSVFTSVDEASAFFERGSLGYSPARRAGHFDGLELRCCQWHVTPLRVDAVSSSFFDDPQRFPPGAAAFDCALLMRGIDHEWHSHDTLCCEAASPA